MRSTYGKMGRWMRTKSVRGLSSRLRIQQKILRSRVRAYRMQWGVGGTGEGAKVWYGLRPISVSRLNPKGSANGVRANGKEYPGAFIGTIRGRREVLRRVGESRLPVEVVRADIADESTTYIEDHVVGTAEFDYQFFRFLEHELKWRTRTQR